MSKSSISASSFYWPNLPAPHYVPGQAVTKKYKTAILKLPTTSVGYVKLDNLLYDLKQRTGYAFTAMPFAHDDTKGGVLAIGPNSTKFLYLTTDYKVVLHEMLDV